MTQSFAWVAKLESHDLQNASDIFKAKIGLIKTIPVDCGDVKAEQDDLEVTFQVIKSFKGTYQGPYLEKIRGYCSDPLSGDPDRSVYKVDSEWYFFIVPNGQGETIDYNYPANDPESYRQEIFKQLEQSSIKGKLK